MRQEPTTKRRVLRSASWGALGFGFGLALAGLTGGAFFYQIYDFNIGRNLGTALYTCAGALGGVALAWGDARKPRALVLALAAAVGLGLGYFVTTTIVPVWIDEQVLGSLYFSVVFTLKYALIGALTGALLGLAQRDRRRTAWLVLAGIVGFGLLYWPSQFGMSVIFDPIWRLMPGASGNDFTQASILSAVRLCVSGAIRGAVTGACLGVGNALPLRPTLRQGPGGSAPLPQQPLPENQS
jgi:hypothetical protein